MTGLGIADLSMDETNCLSQKCQGALPEHQWLKITGKAGVDDFGLIHGPCQMPLVVSGKAFGILNQF